MWIDLINWLEEASLHPRPLSQSISKHLNPSQSIWMHLNASKPPHLPTHSMSLPSASQSPSSPAGPWLRRPLPSLLLPNLPLSLHQTTRVHSTTSDQSIPTLSELPSLSHFLNFSPTTSQIKLPMGAHINQFFSIHFVTATTSGQLLLFQNFEKCLKIIIRWDVHQNTL